MKQAKLYAGLLALILFSACKKEISPVDATSSSIEAVAGRGNELNNGKTEIIFYALGEGNRLDKFSTYDASEILNSATITGIAVGERIIAIDFRPATGQLYGLGSTNRIYVINPKTGVARPIGTAPFTPALAGAAVGFDFNPTVDRIRVVTSTGQNLRLNPETGTVVSVDGPINGVAGAMVTSVAYTNNVAGAAMTILYDIDVTTDKLYKQNPPNNGTLVEVGSLNLDLSGEGGFDIAPPSSNETASAAALAIYQQSSKTALLSIDLTTGKAKKIEKFNSEITYYGIAIPTLPVAYAISGTNLLIFNPENSGTIVTKPITTGPAGSMVALTNLVGLDFRPVNGQLYSVRVVGTSGSIYTINASSGAATFIANISIPVNGTSFGVDFNPVPDRIRVVSDANQNLRINPANGVTTNDGALNPGDPEVTAAAYQNNFAGTTTTTLYVLDNATDKLLIQSPPNAGTLVQVGSLGVDITASNGFDIGGMSMKAYGAFTVGGATNIYTVNLTTGGASAGRSLPGTVSGFTIGLGF